MMSALSYGVRNPGLAVCVLLLSVLCATACGDDGGDGGIDVTPPAPGGAVQIRGTERLSWDQAAPSFALVRQYTFRTYIDGAAAALTGVECLDSSSTTGFPCSARVPQMSNGTHTLQLAAIVDGVESGKSDPLVVTMNQGRIIIGGAAPASTAIEPGGGEPTSLCIASTAECFSVRREIARAAAIASPAVLPDGRLIFIEREREIRISSDGRVTGEAAFTLPEINARIVELLVDPAFERTRFIRIGWVRDSGPYGRTFGIMRLRESSNRFGEAATIVPEIPFRAATDPAVAQDDQGRIYVAIPSPDSGAGSDAYSGELLRFGADGTAFTAGLGSPAFASGFDTPSALSFDPRSQQLWLGGQDRRGRQSLRAMPLGTSEPAAGAPAYRLQQQVYEIATNTRVVALAPMGGAGSSTRSALAIADGNGSLFWSRTEAAGLVLDRALGLPERVVDIAATPNGAILVTTSNAASPPSFSIFRLERRAAPEPTRP